MEKLTIEHLAPYLPYGLSMKVRNDSSEKIWILGAENIGHALTWWKPILRPLSDLIKPIFDGIAPLTIICYEYFGFGKGYISAPEFDLINENGFIGFQMRNQGVYFVREETNYGISTYFTHQLKSNGLWIPQKVTQQLEMFQYLFENHFDVFGLIDAGLAIDINTIKP